MYGLEICRICLTNSSKMFPIQHTRYPEVFEWYTEDTMTMNDQLPCSVCYLCNAVLNRLFNFLENMMNTEIYLKELFRNTSKLTFENIDKLKREMVIKPHNLSKIWLRNSNFIALDTFNGQRPPRELQRYFDFPPIMIEYHKPYEQMNLEEIPEEEEPEIKEELPEEINEEAPEEIKEDDTEVIKVKEPPELKSKLTEQESKSPHHVQKELSYCKQKKSSEHNEEKSLEIENQQNSPEATDRDSETIIVQVEYTMDDDDDDDTEEIKVKEPPEQKSKLTEQESKSPHHVQKELSYCKQKESSEHNEEKSLEIENQQNSPEATDRDSETIIVQVEYTMDDDDDDDDTEEIKVKEPPEQKSKLTEQESKSPHHVQKELSYCKQKESSEHNEEKSLEIENQQKAAEDTDRDSETTVDQDEFVMDDDDDDTKEIKVKGPPEQKSKLTEQESKSPHLVQKELSYFIQKESSEHNEEKFLENENQQKAAEDTDRDSETTVDQVEFDMDDDEIISVGDEITPETMEFELPNIVNMEIVKPTIETICSGQSLLKSELNPFNKQTKTDSIDLFLLCAKKFRSRKEIETTSNVTTPKNMDSELVTNHNSYLAFIEERVETEETSSEKRVNTSYPKKDQNPYLQFVEEHIPNKKNPPEKTDKTTDHGKYVDTYLQFIEEQMPINLQFIEKHMPIDKKPRKERVKTQDPAKYHNPYLQFIEERMPTEKNPTKTRVKTQEPRLETPDHDTHHNLFIEECIPVNEIEQEQTPTHIEVDKHIHIYKPTVPQKTTELTVNTIPNDNYYKPCLEIVEETPVQIPSEPIDINNKPVSELNKLTTTNEPIKIMVTSEPKKYQHSYVDFVKGYESIVDTRKLILDNKDSNQEIVQTTSVLIKRKRKLDKDSNQKIVQATPVKQKKKRKLVKNSNQEIIQTIPVQGKPSKQMCFEHWNFEYQKKYHRTSILRKIQPLRKKPDIKELANKIKNGASILRNTLLNIHKRENSLVTEKKIEDIVVINQTSNDDDKVIIKSSVPQKEISTKYLLLKPKEHSDKLPTEVSLKLPKDIEKKKWHVIEYPVGSKEQETLNFHEDQKQTNEVIILEDQQDQTDDILENQNEDYIQDVQNQMWSDQEDSTMDSQVDNALKILDESLKVEDPSLQNEEHNMSKGQNDLTLADEVDPSSQLHDDSIIITEDEEHNMPRDQDDPSLLVQDFFTQEYQGDSLENQDITPKDQDDASLLVQDVFTQEYQGDSLENEDITPKDQDDPSLLVQDIFTQEYQGDSLENEDITPKDQDDPSLLVQDVFTQEYQGDSLENEDITPKDQDDPSLLVQDVFTQEYQGDSLENQDKPKDQYDQIMEDGSVAVKIESVDEEFQSSLEENHEGNVSDTETYNEDITNPNNDEEDLIQPDIKMEVDQKLQIYDEVSEYEPFLQKQATVIENTEQNDRDVPMNYENLDFESRYNEIQGLNEQEHYAIRNISQICLVPTVKLERLPIALINKINITEETNRRGKTNKFCCAYCNFKSTEQFLMEKHQNVHNMTKKFACNECQKTFKSNYHLSRHKKVHMKRSHRELRSCNECQKTFKSNYHLSRHKKVHRELLPHMKHKRGPRRKFLSTCKVCNKVFRYKASYLRHLENHKAVVQKEIVPKEIAPREIAPSEIAPREIAPKDIVPREIAPREIAPREIAPREIAPKEVVPKEVVSSEEVNNFKCDVCHRIFDTKTKYIFHYRRHSKNKKYSCTRFKRSFNDKSNCTKHIKIHEKIKKRELQDNKKKSIEKANEMELYKKEGEKFVCSLCPKLFDTELELRKHAVDHIL